MPPQFDVSQISSAWLTQTLRDSGVLKAAQVEALHFIGEEKTTMASVVRFDVDYLDNAPPDLPSRYFMKLSDRAPEAWFYRHLAPIMPDKGIIPCYAVLEGQSEDKVWLLFADLEATHQPADDIEPNSPEIVQKRIRLLAKIHAQWWNHPRLKSDIGDFADDVPGYILARTREDLPQYLADVSDILTPEWRARLEKLMASLPLPSWRKRLAERDHFTLVHGDTHEHNFIYPRTEEDTLYIIDWAVWHLNTGVSDIAYLLPADINSTERENVVRFYHNELLANGVTSYTWEQCWQDFREAILTGFTWVIWTHYIGLEREMWHAGLEYNMQLFDELNLDELLA